MFPVQANASSSSAPSKWKKESALTPSFPSGLSYARAALGFCWIFPPDRIFCYHRNDLLGQITWVGGRFLARQKTSQGTKGSFLPHEPGGCTKYFDIVLHLIAKAPVKNPLLYLMRSFLVIPGWQDYRGRWGGGWRRPKGREGGGRKIGELEPPVFKGSPSQALCPCSLISCPASPKLHF